MKKVHFTILVMLFTSAIFSQTTLVDNFDNLDGWTLFGDPLPQYISSIFGQDGIFDNNGDPNNNSGGISNQTFNLSSGFVLESNVYLDFSDINGCWAGASVGIANPTYQSSWGGYEPYLTVGIQANGYACWGSPVPTQGHTIFYGDYIIDGGGWETIGDLSVAPIYIDQYANGWHTMKIEVDQNRMPKFYVDNVLLYTGTQPIASSVFSENRKIIIGDRSSGSAGKAYHNWVKLSPYVQTTLLTDNFDNLDGWTLFGDPLPQYISSIFGQDGIFDNNGDPNNNSGGISNQTFNLSSGFVLESNVYLDFSDINGCWAGASVGIANPTYQSSWGGYEPYLTVGIQANGYACWGSPVPTQGHTIFYGDYIIDGGGWETIGDLSVAPIYIDQYANGWHTMKIEVDQNRMPKFYVDNVLLYTGTQPIASSVFSENRKIIIGDRSSGSAGKAYHNWVSLNKIVVGIEDQNYSANKYSFELIQNFPNPFNPSTIIKYSLAKAGYVTIKVFDLLGREVSTLLNEFKNPGNYEITFVADGLSSGIYLYRLQTENNTQMKKMILLR